jgi:hypothetical protein
MSEVTAGLVSCVLLLLLLLLGSAVFETIAEFISPVLVGAVIMGALFPEAEIPWTLD